MKEHLDKSVLAYSWLLESVNVIISHPWGHRRIVSHSDATEAKMTDATRLSDNYYQIFFAMVSNWKMLNQH